MDPASIALLTKSVRDLASAADSIGDRVRRGRKIPGSELNMTEAILYLAQQARDLAERVALLEARIEVLEDSGDAEDQ